MTIKILPLLLLVTITSHAQDLDSLKSTVKPRKFIDKVELFAGPNLSFNYGSKFIENYKDENVTNTRLLKWGYVAGVGVNHPFTNRIDLNVRLQYETKGTKNELNLPRVHDDTRVIITSEYTYHYLTLSAIPIFEIGNKETFRVGVGGYFSRISGLQGYEKTYFTREEEIFSEAKFTGRIFRDLNADGGQYAISTRSQLRGIEKNDFGSVFFIGYSIPVNEKKQHINLQLVNNLGFKNINRNNPYKLEEKNHTWSLTIGYTFIRN